MRVTDLAPLAIIFVVAGISLGIGAEVLLKVREGVTSGSTAESAINNSTEGVGELARWMPTIGLVLAAAIIIGVVFSSFVGTGKGAV